MIGLIGGTGFYGPGFLNEQEKVRIDTPYGEIEVFLGKIGKEKVVLIPRHGDSHKIPPHRVKYRGNISALKATGVDRVVSINSVGSLDKSLSPGHVLIPHDFLEFTNARESTFYDDEVVHVDMTEPYCNEIRTTLIGCAEGFYKKVFNGGVYVCTQGPRFETPAEIRMLRRLGGDVVGMVGYPEVALAREAGLCYASICTIANYGSGISDKPLSIEEVRTVVSENIESMRKTIKCAVKSIPKTRGCSCADHIKEARV